MSEAPRSPIAAVTAQREILLRLVTAALLAPAILAAIVAGGLWTLATVVILVVLAMREFYGLIEAKGVALNKSFGFVAGAALPVIAFFGNEYHATLLIAAVLLAVMVAALGRVEIGEALSSISGTFFGVFYIGWLLSHAVLLRAFARVVETKWGVYYPVDAGIFLLLFAVTTVACCDTGAYFTGRAFGRRPLARAISPGKTIEGVAGGVAAACGAALLLKGLFAWFWPELAEGLPWSYVLPFAVLLAAAGIVGDLVESLLKRDAARKDTGSLLPGMGGFLDRLDSALLAIPLMYYAMLGLTYVRFAPV